MKENETIDVSIIICTYNRVLLLEKTINSLFSVDKIFNSEIIVIDNNSTDTTKEVVLKYKDKLPIKYIFEEKQGLSVARNRGINESRGKILAFLDDDAIPNEYWLNEIIDAFKLSENIAAIGGKILPNFEINRPDWLVSDMELPYTIVDLGDNIKSYSKKIHPFGANMAIRSNILKELMFPEQLGRKGDSLLSNEETWVFKKIREKGYTLLYIPKMSVKHFIPKERLQIDWILRRYYYQGVSRYNSCENSFQKLKLFLDCNIRLCYIIISLIQDFRKRKIVLNKCRLNSLLGSYRSLFKIKSNI